MISRTQRLNVPFTCRFLNGQIQVILQPNQDPDTAWGFNLISPSVPQSDYPRQYFSFPVMTAEIEYPLPSNPTSGYGSLFGWIQFVKTTKDNKTKVEIDLYPAFERGSNSPFATWGYKPTLFDAPSRMLSSDGKGEALVWRAQSFLCFLEDAGMKKRVNVCLGAGFEWGFDVEVAADAGERGAGSRNIVIKDADLLDVEREWNARVILLKELYPEWEFRVYGAQ